MKNLLWALVMTGLAIGMPWLAWSQFADVSRIYDGGSDGALTIEEQTGTRTSRKGAKTYYYSGALEGTPVKLSTDRVLKTGIPYRAIYLPGKLEVYAATQEKGSFTDYVMGNKGEPKWDLFVRKIRSDLLWIGVLIEILWVSCAVLFFWSFLKKEK
jgi:hypothetical protein